MIGLSSILYDLVVSIELQPVQRISTPGALRPVDSIRFLHRNTLDTLDSFNRNIWM